MLLLRYFSLDQSGGQTDWPTDRLMLLTWLKISWQALIALEGLLSQLLMAWRAGRLLLRSFHPVDFHEVKRSLQHSSVDRSCRFVVVRQLRLLSSVDTSRLSKVVINKSTWVIIGEQWPQKHHQFPELCCLSGPSAAFLPQFFFFSPLFEWIPHLCTLVQIQVKHG